MVEKPLLKAKDNPFFNPFLGGSVSQEWMGQFGENGWVNLNENGWVSLARIYNKGTVLLKEYEIFQNPLKWCLFHFVIGD